MMFYSDVAPILLTLALTVILVWISVIDWRRYVIPNSLNILLLGVGCLAQLLQPSNIVSSLAGAAGLFALFAGVRFLHHRATGRMGLGFGDVKMAGAAGMWIGIGAIPAFLLISSTTALVAFGLLHVVGRFDSSSRIPFGPFLAIALAVCWLSPDLMEATWETYA